MAFPEPSTHKKNIFENLASNVAKATGSTPAFIIAVSLVIIWLITGPLFHYSETWQLIINTGTTIITFLMVFLIQKVQNKDSLAIQLKLNELLAAHEMASNRMVNVEGLSEEELKMIQEYYCRLNEVAKNSSSLHESHSIDEAEQNAIHKSERRKGSKELDKK